jgi:hypothetical protein
MSVYRLYRGEGTEAELARTFLAQPVTPQDEFYSLFYLSLWAEARHQHPLQAEGYMRAALRTNYARVVNDRDFMVTTAKV